MLGTKWHAPVTHPPTSSHLLPEDQQRLYLARVYHSLYVANFNPPSQMQSYISAAESLNWAGENAPVRAAAGR